MKNSYKVALLAALGFVAASAAQAQTVGTVSVNANYTTGDLLLGIYEPGAANTLVVDIGSYASLQSGETWNISSFLSTAGITLDANAEYGVIGNSTTAHSFYVTSTTTSPTTLSSATAGTWTTAIGTIGGFQGAQGATAVGATTAGDDWYGQTLDSAAGTSFLVNTADYQVNASVGTADTLYDVVGSGTATHPTGISTTELTFDLSTSGELTYGTVSSVPEPTTYGMIAAAGLLVISLRNKLSRKQA
jgi:hypothetical protein